MEIRDILSARQLVGKWATEAIRTAFMSRGRDNLQAKVVWKARRSGR